MTLESDDKITEMKLLQSNNVENGLADLIIQEVIDKEIQNEDKISLKFM